MHGYSKEHCKLYMWYSFVHSWKCEQVHVPSTPQVLGAPVRSLVPGPLPGKGFFFMKVDLSRVVLFGGRQRHLIVNEVHILDMDNWVNI